MTDGEGLTRQTRELGRDALVRVCCRGCRRRLGQLRRVVSSEPDHIYDCDRCDRSYPITGPRMFHAYVSALGTGSRVVELPLRS
ncbi:MAG: hypothetical protein GEV10_13800 [Streptosporangiales bacterium]|nr:hypothetical protein [Streptosporangiales bacterium]